MSFKNWQHYKASECTTIKSDSDSAHSVNVRCFWKCLFRMYLSHNLIAALVLNTQYVPFTSHTLALYTMTLLSPDWRLLTDVNCSVLFYIPRVMVLQKHNGIIMENKDSVIFFSKSLSMLSIKLVYLGIRLLKCLI